MKSAVITPAAEKQENLAKLSMSDHQIKELNRVSLAQHFKPQHVFMMIYSTSDIDLWPHTICSDDSSCLFPPVVILMVNLKVLFSIVRPTGQQRVSLIDSVGVFFQRIMRRSRARTKDVIVKLQFHPFALHHIFFKLGIF